MSSAGAAAGEPGGRAGVRRGLYADHSDAPDHDVRGVLAIRPFRQLWLSLGLLLVSAYGIVRISAALFRAQNLLSGETFSLGRYLRALAGRS